MLRRSQSLVMQVVFLALGVLSAVLGLKGFLIPSGFIDGGITGVSMLIALLSDAHLAWLLVAINLPFVIVGFTQLSAGFAIRSALGIAALAASLALLHIPLISNDRLLAAVFGGFFLGAGIGLSIRAGGVLDGTEILALLISRKLGTTVGDIVLLLNIAIFGVAGVFLGIETALYSMLTYFSVSRTIDFLVHGLEEYYGLIIVSAKNEEIRQRIISDLGRGVTIYRGRGGKSDTDQDIVFCVATRIEIPKIKELINEIDDAAFFVTHHMSEVSGGVLPAILPR